MIKIAKAQQEKQRRRYWQAHEYIQQVENVFLVKFLINLSPHHCDSFNKSDSFDESWPRNDAEHIAAPSKFDGGDII